MKTKILLLLCAFLAGMAHADPLTPARSLIGTWKTPFSVTFHIKTDFCTGLLQEVARNKRLVTWVITAGPDESTVNIQQTFQSKNFRIINQDCGATGYTPDLRTNFYTGRISGTRLYIKEGSRRVGTFHFTTHLMKGDWKDAWSLLYGQKVYTVNQELQLKKL